MINHSVLFKIISVHIGIVEYQLQATDDEQDTIKFKLTGTTKGLGKATLSPNGL